MDAIIEFLLTTDIDMEYILKPLINELNYMAENNRESIAEINFLDKFLSYEVTFPEKKFCPKQIIEYMKNKHESFKMEIQIDPHFQKFINYKYSDKLRTMNFTFSNNMSFVTDIFTICYLHYIFGLLSESENITAQIIYEIYELMLHKYKIMNDDLEPSNNAITGLKIIESFPSVFLHWYGYHIDPTKSIHSPFHFASTIFPDINKLLWYPKIATIIPKLHRSQNVPLPLLVALHVKTEEYIKNVSTVEGDFSYIQRSLDQIIARVNELYNSEVFPESLKLEICEKWGIVNKVGMEYEYADYFYINFDEAVHIICTTDTQNRSYQQILSEICTKK